MVNGAALSASLLAKLVSIRVQRTLRLPSRATLRFSDEGYAVVGGGTFSVGTDVTIGVIEGSTLMSGTVIKPTNTAYSTAAGPSSFAKNR